MNTDEVIAKLTIENFDLKAKIYEFEETIANIKGLLYCIGGPLNDNVLNYTKKQLLTFFKIRDLIKE
jgi:hypothetical protein